MTRTPKSLILRLRNPGDLEARERAVTLFLPLVVKWSKRLGVNEHDTEDIIQDVFMTLFERFAKSSYDHEKPFRPWLCGMLKRKASQLEKKAFVRKRRAHVMDQLPVREAVEPDFDIDDRDLLQGALKVVQSQVEPTTYRAFVMCKLEGERATDVAKELKKSVDTIYQSVSRVMQRLREILDGIVKF